jgi:membrane-bound lytic murein transglycosylase A
LITADLGLFRKEWTGQMVIGRRVDGKFVPYPTRSEIDAGALAGKGYELLWVDDAVDAFFLHVQGSGRVVMEDGKVVRLGFAGRNGHSYVAIGRELIEQGAIPRERMSMQAIRAWLAAHPDQAGPVMASNPSFIFFRIIDGEGPIGAEGVPLTPGRSLAVDPEFVPLGLPIWLDTTDPLDPRQPLRRLVVAQDTGAAIKGPVRGDLFWGFGENAAARAGAMKQQGRYFLLLPKKAPGA